MKSTTKALALAMATLISAQAEAQKYYARQYLAGLKEASAASPTDPAAPETPKEPDKPAEPVGPCENSGFSYNAIRGGGVTVGRYVATRIPAQMCRGGDVFSPTNERHILLGGDDNLNLYFSDNKVYWTSSTQYRGSSTLATQPNGDVQLLANNGQVIWSTGTGGNPGAFAAMAQTGSMIVVSADGRNILWSTNTDWWDYANVEDGTAKDSENVAGTVVPINVERNESVVSPNGMCKFTVQMDTNMHIFAGTNHVWTSSTQYKGGYRLTTRPDGNVVFAAANGVVTWETGTAGHPGARMRILDNCDLAVYQGQTMVWHTGSIAPMAWTTPR